MQEVQDMLNRMVTLATQSANGTYDDSVDRANLQKEVDALKSEINRIADSSNFNGINLLDGKLGLNTAAFTTEAVAAQTTSTGANINLTYDVNSNKHVEASAASGANPSASLDFGNLEVKVAGGTATASVAVSIGGITYTATLSNETTVGNGNAKTTAATFGADDISAALVAAIKKDANAVSSTATTKWSNDATAGTNDTIKIGNGWYKVSGGTGTVDLAFVGLDNSGVDEKTADGDFTSSDAKSLNDALGATVAATVNNGTASGNEIHGLTVVKDAVADEPAKLAGIDVKLDSDVVKDGNTLTIDGQTFIFKTDKNSTTAASGSQVLIDVSNDSDQIQAAVDKLSQQTAFGDRKWQISAAGKDAIHVDQTVATAAGKSTIDTEAALKALITAKGADTAAANAGTKIKITEGSINDGDVLTIDGKTYVFSDDANYSVPSGATLLGKTNAAQNLQNAITGSVLNSDGSVTVYATDSTATTGPSVLGKGVTLQIGDTSDSYNQLGLTINDIHTNALGLDGVNIADQEDAQSAIQIIKNAINNVSSTRGDLGALQNRLEHTSNNLSVMAENIQDAESTIRDTDIAEEMMSYTKNSILVQSAQAMLAQANTVPQGVLQLLQ
jgi:flagellin